VAKPTARVNHVTMLDVARVADVSVGTVSRVVNDNKSVKPALRARVLDAMGALQYEPNLLAQSMRTGTTNVIGCVVPNLSIPFFSQSVEAMEGVLHQHGYTIVLTNSHDQLERELEIISLFRRRQLDGLIASVSSETHQPLLQMLQGLDVPAILVQRSLPLPLDSVVNDHFEGVVLAMDYLLNFGHARVAIITGPRNLLPGRERARAFEQTLRARGLSADQQLTHYYGPSPDVAGRLTHEMLTGAHPPTAIIAGANQMIGVLKIIRELRISVPERLSLISLGDMELAELVTPSLTAIRWDNAKLGRTAAELMIGRLSGNVSAAPVHVMLPAELVLRDSCSAP
jgi:LacI family transcriptional regulator